VKDWTQGVAYRTNEGIVCADCFCNGGANLDEIDGEEDILTADEFEELQEEGEVQASCADCECPVDMSVCAEHVLYGVPKDHTTAHYDKPKAKRRKS
jgi:hypothetical protein